MNDELREGIQRLLDEIFEESEHGLKSLEENNITQACEILNRIKFLSNFVLVDDWEKWKQRNEEAFILKLRGICLQFDAKAGVWPEHELEGYAVYAFAKDPTIDLDTSYSSLPYDKEYEGELERMEGQ